MLESSCLDVFAGIGCTSFERLPLPLRRPRQGHTWSLSWQAGNGALVTAGQVLLSITSDSDGESLPLPAPVPGRLHICVPDRRFVPVATVVGELEFGTALPPLPVRRPDNGLLERESALLNTARTELTRLKHRIASLRQVVRVLTLRRQKLLALKTGRTACTDPEDGAAALLQELLSRSQAGISREAGGDPLLRRSLLQCARTLSSLPFASGILKDGGGGRRELVARLYEQKIQAVRSDPAFSEEIRAHQSQCWEEIRDLHLHRLDAR
jgi:hypothetical protein